MPPLLKFTFFTSTLHPKPLNSLLLRCAAVPFSPPAYSPRRNHSISQPHRTNPSLLGFQIQSQPQLQLRLQSSFIYTYKTGKEGEGGVSVARFSRRGVGGVGGGGGSGGSGLFGDMGSETDNSDHNLLNSALLKHSNNDELSHSPSKQPRHQSNKFLTLPTILTIGRVAAVPLLICTFYTNTWWGTTATTSIFIAAAITDWLDGYLARKMKLGSAFGAFLDPVADKLMVAATLVLLCTKPPEVALLEQSPWLLTIPSIAIIGREITMSAVREWAASQSGNLSEAVAVNNLGKWKTATQMIAITILLATRDSSLAGPGVLVASGVTLLYISAWLALWSLVVYMKKIWKVLLK